MDFLLSEWTAEFWTHPALVAHPHPRRVAVLADADARLARTVSQHVLMHHTVEICYQVDVVTEPRQGSPSNSTDEEEEDARLVFYSVTSAGDGLAWLQEQFDHQEEQDKEEDNTELLDVILVDMA